MTAGRGHHNGTLMILARFAGTLRRPSAFNLCTYGYGRGDASRTRPRARQAGEQATCALWFGTVR
jgi:hypothetical protein